jgi:hypothetical protein
MNDRKRAWQILHTEIRCRVTDETDWNAWETNIGTIVREADSKVTLIIELAGFGATFALMTQNDPLDVADRIGATIMGEDDYPEDDDAV